MVEVDLKFSRSGFDGDTESIRNGFEEDLK